MTIETSYPRDKINILLLEGIHDSAADRFERSGYNVRRLKEALGEDDLLEAIQGVHLLGIRSKTHVTKKVLDAASSLLGLGCFCIGTNQVDLNAASSRGVPVFNAPFSNTRSVAELVLAEVIMLARKTTYRNALMHQGQWDKSASGSYEVRGKKIGIIGYGHIGPQVGLLAEALGMQVYYYDISKKLPLGNAKQVDTLEELLKTVQFVTLHVPETEKTKGMFGKKEIAAMQEGSYLLNLSRGSVVDLEALRAALDSGHVAGAAIDVYPEEPESNSEPFESVLRGANNVILTPHIGGSTLEAQYNIGIEVADLLLGYTETGSSVGAVNFPEHQLPVVEGDHRILNVHKNVPGVLSSINQIIADNGVNISAQYLSTQADIGYLIMDVGRELSQTVKEAIEALDENIKTRLLY